MVRVTIIFKSIVILLFKKKDYREAACCTMHQIASIAKYNALRLRGTINRGCISLIIVITWPDGFLLNIRGPDKNYPRTTTTFQQTHTKPRGNVRRASATLQVACICTSWLVCKCKSLRNNYSCTPRAGVVVSLRANQVLAIVVTMEKGRECTDLR